MSINKIKSATPNAANAAIKKRIVLIDDDPDFHEIVKTELKSSPNFQLNACYLNLQDFFSENQEPIDVILLDYYLGDTEGVENIFEIKRKISEDTEIVMITVEDNAEYILRCIRAGATGYFIKNNFFNSLDADLSVLIQGGAAMSPFVARLLVESFSPKSNIKSLNPKEEAILKGLSQGKKYQEVANDLAIDINTVRYYVKKIYKKLHVNNRLDAVSKWLNN